MCFICTKFYIRAIYFRILVSSGEIKGQKCANCKSLLLETILKGTGKRKVGRINGRVETEAVLLERQKMMKVKPMLNFHSFGCCEQTGGWELF